MKISVVHDKAPTPPRGTDAVRQVPLLRILDSTERGSTVNRIVVGVVRISAVDESATVFVQQTRSSSEGWVHAADADVSDPIVERLTAELAAVRIELAPGGEEAWASAVAKAVAEGSRDSAGALRRLRYELEGRISAELRNQDSPERGNVLASLLELQLAASIVADLADNAIREGLYLWLTDSEAYHRYRYHRDDSLIIGEERKSLTTWSWMRSHDAGVRQCEALAAAMRADVAAITTLLSAAATLASNREAEAQQTSNTLLSVAALALGVPALLLALYSADRLVPLRSGTQLLALIPIGASLLVAGLIAAGQVKVPKSKRLLVWGVVAVLIGLLVLSGVIAP